MWGFVCVGGGGGVVGFLAIERIHWSSQIEWLCLNNNKKSVFK